jgi:filamentous hemagglutinin family protein
VAAGSLVLLASTAYGLPQGASVKSGSVSISQPTANTMQIDQHTPKTIINWQGYSILTGEAVQYVQPGASSIALNRVIGVDPSYIYGQLSGNGQIWVINPNGLLVGPNAKIETGSFLGSTLNISDRNFLAGNYTFTNPSASSLGSIVNSGDIIALKGGYVALVSPSVTNGGKIIANAGNVVLASGEEMTLNFSGNNLISLVVDKATQNALGIANTGTIIANGGTVLLSARVASDILKNVVNNTGIIEAKSLVDREGQIILDGGDAGIVANSGTLDVSSRGPGAQGGSIGIFGQYVGLFDGAKVNASGDAGGGTILIGGNFHGSGPEPNASMTYVGSNVTISADAITSGNGGKVAVWSDNGTTFLGSISAKGGAQGGDGGFVEVSGKNYLDFNGLVNTLAPMGHAGTLLLDPAEISIEHGSRGTDTSITVTGEGPFTNTSSGGGSVLMDGTINSQLNYNNVTVTTTTNDIVINNTAGTVSIYPVNSDGNPAGSNSSTLTLNSAANISWNGAWSYTNNGQLTLYASGGTISGGTNVLTIGGSSPLLMQAASGIGSFSTPVVTSGVSSLAAGTGTGGISLSNSGSDVTITALTNPVTGGTVNGLSTSASGDIQLINNGAIIITAPISAAGGDVYLTASGPSGWISESASGLMYGGGGEGYFGSISTTGTLYTSSVAGQDLEGANTVSFFNAVNGTVGGGGSNFIALNNTAPLLTITGINDMPGLGPSVTNYGSIAITGPIQGYGGGVYLTASGPSGSITESGGGLISTTGTLGTSSAAGQTLNGANTVSFFNATNVGNDSAGSGSIALTNTVPLTITGINDQAGIGDTVTNTGAIIITGPIYAFGGNVSLKASGPSGSITESGGEASGFINTTGTLTTSSVAGQTLNGPNAVSGFNATNTTSGSIAFANTATPLTISGISDTAGISDTVTNYGPITITGPIQAAGGAVNLTASGASGSITESGGGLISTTGTLTTSSVAGQNLQNNNAVGTLNATDAAGGNIQFTNTIPLTIAAMTTTGTGMEYVSNTGAISITGTVGTGGGSVTLIASGPSASITESGTGSISTTGALITSSAGGGQNLQNNNAVGTLYAVNTGEGSIQFTNTIPLTIADMTTTGTGSDTVTNYGPITITEPIQAAGGNVYLTAFTQSGSITESGSGLVSTPGTLTTKSVAGQTLNGANAVSGFNATNATDGDYSASGDIALTNTVPLTITGTGISNTSGNVTVTNTGAITNSGSAATAIDTSTGNGSITLSGASIGTHANPVTLSEGSGSLNLTAGTGGIYVNQVAGPLATSQIATLSAPTGQAIEITDSSGAITVNNALNAGADTLLLQTTNVAGKNIDFSTAGSSLASTAAVTLNATGAITNSGSAATAIDTSTGNGSITLSGASIGTSPNPITLSEGSGTVSLNTTGTGNANVKGDTLNFATSTVGGSLTATALTGAITQSGPITAALLTTTSVNGTTLNSPNAVSGFNGTNTGSGDIVLNNTVPLTINGISNTGTGSDTVNNTGPISISGRIAGGNVNLTASGPSGSIAETGSGLISTTGTLTTSSVAGQTLTGSNAVGTLNARDLGGGNIQFTNTVPLTISAMNTTGTGSDTVNNIGAITITGTVGTGSGPVNLASSSTIGETGSGLISTTGTLTTSSVGGQTLTGSNTVSGLNATNTASGSIALTNTAAPLTITGISNTGGGTDTVNSTGWITITGPIQAYGGNVGLTASGPSGSIGERSSGLVSTTGTLTTSSVDGQVLTGSNTVGTLNAADTGGKNIWFTNTIPLTIAAMSTTGNDTVNVTGPISIAGTIAGANVSLTTSGPSGSITETGSGLINTAGWLTTSSVAGQNLSGANTVSFLTATNTSSGDIVLNNTVPVTIQGISNTGTGSDAVNNTGPITITGTVGTGSGPVNLASSSTIAESGSGLISTTGTLTTLSVGGQTLNGSNAVGNLNAADTGGGNIGFTNTIPLSIAAMSTTGSDTVNNTGPIGIAGTIAGANVSLTASGPSGSITESGSGLINTAGTLTTSSVAGQDLSGANTVSFFTATNTGHGEYPASGSIVLNNTANPLTITGITDTAGNSDTVSNYGAITITGPISASSGNVNLSAFGLSGSITEYNNTTESYTGSISTTGTLTTFSMAGQDLSGANTVSFFNATNGSEGGSGDIVLNNTANPLTITGISNTVGGSDTVTNTGPITITGPISAADGGAVNLTASGPSGSITEYNSSSESNTGTISTTGTLTTKSVAGQDLSGANTVSSFNATNVTDSDSYSSSGSITLRNTANPLTITGITDTAGNSDTVTNTGPISITGAIQAPGGAVNFTASGAIGETGGGFIATDWLYTSSVAGQTLLGANTVSSFNAFNVGQGEVLASGNIVFNNLVPLTITGAEGAGGTGISNTGGNVTVTNTGALTTIGQISTGTNGSISLTATNGTETIGGTVTAGGSGPVTLAATGDLLVSANVASGSGTIDANSGGNITLTNASITTTGNVNLNASGNINGGSTYGQNITLGANTIGLTNTTYVYPSNSTFGALLVKAVGEQQGISAELSSSKSAETFTDPDGSPGTVFVNGVPVNLAPAGAAAGVVANAIPASVASSEAAGVASSTLSVSGQQVNAMARNAGSEGEDFFLLAGQTVGSNTEAEEVASTLDETICVTPDGMMMITEPPCEYGFKEAPLPLIHHEEEEE